MKRYATHDYDAVLGMYYAKARMYDAENRRFASVDPVKGNITDPLSLVQYLYVVDNPLRWVDPLGRRPEKESYEIENIVNTRVTEHVTRYINGNGRHIRAEPKVTGMILKTLNDNDPVIYQGEKKQSGGYSWAKVECNGLSGWIQDQYLKLQPTYQPKDWKKDLGNEVDNTILNGLMEIENLKIDILELSHNEDFVQNKYLNGNMEAVEKLQNKLVEISQNTKPISYASKQLVLSAFSPDYVSNAETVIYSYFPPLLCASANGRIFARTIAQYAYDEGFQYGEVKRGNYVDGTNANAFVHSLWSGYIYTELVIKHGYSKSDAQELAWIATAMHEYSDAGATKNLEWISNVNMDMSNNSLGIRIASELIDNDYRTGLFRVDNWSRRMQDLAATIADAVSNGQGMRNKRINYETSNKEVVTLDSNGYALYPTNGDERILSSDQIRAIIEILMSQ